MLIVDAGLKCFMRYAITMCDIKGMIFKRVNLAIGYGSLWMD